MTRAFVIGALSGSIITVVSALLFGPQAWEALFPLAGLFFGSLTLSAE